jgi:hypothetical protein
MHSSLHLPLDFSRPLLLLSRPLRLSRLTTAYSPASMRVPLTNFSASLSLSLRAPLFMRKICPAHSSTALETYAFVSLLQTSRTPAPTTQQPSAVHVSRRI